MILSSQSRYHVDKDGAMKEGNHGSICQEEMPWTCMVIVSRHVTCWVTGVC